MERSDPVRSSSAELQLLGRWCSRTKPGDTSWWRGDFLLPPSAVSAPCCCCCCCCCSSILLLLACTCCDLRRDCISEHGTVRREATASLCFQLTPGSIIGLAAEGRSSPPQHMWACGLLEKWHMCAMSSVHRFPLGLRVLQMCAQGWLQLWHWQCRLLGECTSWPT